MSIIYYNSNFIKYDDLFIKYNNRAFNYGDGFFETIRIINSKAFNFKSNYSRYLYACNILKIKDIKSFDFFSNIICQLINENNIKHGYAKIHISRSGEGKYQPNSFTSNVLITMNSCDKFKINNPISLCIFSKQLKSKSNLSNIKSINSLIPVLASIYAMENNVDNALLINTNHNIIEATNANLFCIKGKTIFTPPKEDGPVLGTMRDWILTQVEVRETSLTVEDLINSDEVFITNSTSGIVSVKSIGTKNFNDTFKNANKLQNKLISLSLDH